MTLHLRVEADDEDLAIRILMIAGGFTAEDLYDQGTGEFHLTLTKDDGPPLGEWSRSTTGDGTS